MKFLILVLTAFLISPSARGTGTETLLLSFDGKGTAMAWDAGVSQALLERLKLEKIKEILYVGSSSGSVVSTYFACRGFNAETAKSLPGEALKFPKTVLNEDGNDRALKLLLDINPEIPFEAVRPLVDLAMLGGKCLPKVPLLIVASNLDVIEGRNGKPFSGRRDRTFDIKTFELSEGNKVLGKVCTYFVTDPMARILEAVPEQERLCDLRFIRSPEDLRLAIQASVTEPTYFPPPSDPDLTKIRSVHPIPKKRTYLGGFVLLSAPHDVKRAVPQAWVFGTGRASYSRLPNRIMLNWFSYPINKTLLQQRWFFDEQVQVPMSEWNTFYDKKTTNADLVRLGYAKAKACFDGKGCKPALFEKPFYSLDAWGKPLDEFRGRGIKALF